MPLPVPWEICWDYEFNWYVSATCTIRFCIWFLATSGLQLKRHSRFLRSCHGSGLVPRLCLELTGLRLSFALCKCSAAPVRIPSSSASSQSPWGSSSDLYSQSSGTSHFSAIPQVTVWLMVALLLSAVCFPQRQDQSHPHLPPGSTPITGFESVRVQSGGRGDTFVWTGKFYPTELLPITRDWSPERLAG